MKIWKAYISIICILVLLMLGGCSGEETSGAPGGQEGDVPGRAEEGHRENSGENGRIEVGTVKELYQAIGPNREILIKPGTYLLSELEGQEETNSCVGLLNMSEDIELTIKGVENLAITGLGDKPVEILSQPGDANIMVFDNVKGIKLSNIRAGHWPEKSFCSQGVLKFTNCQDIVIDDSQLFGCGVRGLELEDVNGFEFNNSYITDCTMAIMEIRDSEDIGFLNSGFMRNQGVMLLNIHGSRHVVFENCDFRDNVAGGTEGAAFIYSDGGIRFKDCVIKNNKSVHYSMVIGNPEGVVLENVVMEGNYFTKDGKPPMGNSAGNMVNGGIAAAYGEWVYYINGADENRLYRMNRDGDNNTRLCDDSVSYINVIRGVVYYVNRSDNNHIYLIYGEDNERISVNDTPANYFSIVGNRLFYTDLQEGGVLCTLYMGEGQSVETLNTQESRYVNIVDDMIYYVNAGDDSKICRIGTDGTNYEVICNDRAAYINVVGDWIYYINVSDGNGIYRIHTDGTGRSRVSGSRAGSLNVNEQGVFFSNTSDGGKLYKLDLEGEGPEVKLNHCESSNINVIGHWIYYMDAGEDMATYRIKADGTDREKLEGI